MKILIIEDEHTIAEALRKGLMQEKYSVDLAYDGQAGYEMAGSNEYDLIILDLMLPKMDGMDICLKLRAEEIHTPILMLTAKYQIDDRVAGLNAGADDYLSKPFAFEELLARIKALLRRPASGTDTNLGFGDIAMDSKTFEVHIADKLLSLSNKEYLLLEYMLRNPKIVHTKQQLISHVWDYDSDILPNTVEVYVGKLRSKGIPITTMRGFGYKLGI